MENSKRTAKKNKILQSQTIEHSEKDNKQGIEKTVRLSDAKGKSSPKGYQTQQRAGNKERKAIKQSIECNPSGKQLPSNPSTKRLKLLVTTLLDTQSIHVHLLSYKQSLKLGHQLTLPQLYYLIGEYQRIFDRAYPEEVRYYIVGALWDQGVVKVGEEKDWRELLHQERRDMARREGPHGAYYAIYRDALIAKLSALVTGRKITQPLHNKQQNNQEDMMSPQLVVVIEQLQQQYHRQKLTLSQLPQSPLQSLTSVFSQLDTEKTGIIPLPTIISQLCLPFLSDTTSQQALDSTFNVHKWANNVHVYDHHENIVRHGHGHTLMEGGVRVENVMELVNRLQVGQHTGAHASETYQTISHILKQYHAMAKYITHTTHQQQVEGIRDGDGETALAAKLEHIRQAACDIVSHGRHRQMPLRTPTLGREEQYETHKQEARYQDTAKTTHRQWQTINNHEQSANIKPFRLAAEEKYEMERQRDIVEGTRRLEEARHEAWQHCRRYDQLLRVRICNEMDVVRLEKIRNRIKYYDILHP